MSNLVRRRDAAQAAFDRFHGRRFRWGVNDCARLAAFTLRKLGHKPPMPAAGSYRTAFAAAKALRAHGFASLEAALDGLGLQRIPVAAAIVGDVICVPGDNDLAALWIVLGNGRALGWHEDSERCEILQPNGEGIAWRSCI